MIILYDNVKLGQSYDATYNNLKTNLKIICKLGRWVIAALNVTSCHGTWLTLNFHTAYYVHTCTKC